MELGPFHVHHHRLLASRDGTGPVDGCHTQIRAVLVHSDHMPDAAESGPSILTDGGPHVRSNTCISKKQTLWAFRLLVSVLCVCLFILIKKLVQFRTTGHPLQMLRHGSSQRLKGSHLHKFLKDLISSSKRQTL